MKLLIDTNILFDHLAKRNPYRHEAATLLKMAEAYIVPITVNNLYYGTRKSLKKEAVLEYIDLLMTFLRITPFRPETVRTAVTSGFPDFEDGLQYASALEAGCSVIVTRNKKDFKKSRLPVLSAGEFLEQFPWKR